MNIEKNRKKTAKKEISRPLNGSVRIKEVIPRVGARPTPQAAHPGAIIPRNKPIDESKLRP